MMTRVKADVFSTTKESQEPWHNSSLRNEVYLVPPQNLPTPEPQIQPPVQGTSVEAEWNLVKTSGSVAVLDAFIATHADNRLFVALAEERKSQLTSLIDSASILDSLAIPKSGKTSAPQSETATEIIKKGALEQLALNNEQPQGDAPPSPEQTRSLQQFFESGKDANDGNSKYALLGPPTVDVPTPSKNPGNKVKALSLQKITTAPTLEVLLASNPDFKFDEENATSCRLDWIDRCPFLPTALVQRLTEAMAAAGMDINNHNSNYFEMSKLTGTDDYLLANSPSFGTGDVAIIAAIITPAGEVKQLFGFDLSQSKLGTEGGDVPSNIVITDAAVEGDDIYVSFDSSYRCTEKPRKFGLLVKFGMADRVVKWVSPFNVSDVGIILRDDGVLAGNGGSCAEDFLYKINKDSGAVLSRVKLPTAIERMSLSGDVLLLQLYEGAAAYQAP